MNGRASALSLRSGSLGAAGATGAGPTAGSGAGAAAAAAGPAAAASHVLPGVPGTFPKISLALLSTQNPKMAQRVPQNPSHFFPNIEYPISLMTAKVP